MSARERIEKLQTHGYHSGFEEVVPMDDEPYLLRDEVLAAIDEPWQDRPEPGRWFVSLDPRERGRYAAIIETTVTVDGAWMPHAHGSGPIPLSDPMFAGAKWQPRRTPADPFAKEGA